MTDNPPGSAAWWDWQPLPRRWFWWPACALQRHRVVGSYCRCRAVVSFKIVRGLDG